MKKLIGLSFLAMTALAGCPNPMPPLPPNPVPPPGPTVIEGNGEPLIVDWKPQHRGDLEIAMHDGIAVVEYTDKGFRLLKNCSVAGTYNFVGMSTKEQLVRLESADDVRANLPLGGAGLVGQIGGELGKSTTLDVAMVMIGKIRTVSNHVSVKDLQGNCKGATHFVKGAMVGAFVMDTGDKAHARAVAEFFSIGAEGGGRRESKVHNSDGTLEECKHALPDAKSAPAKCGALLRVELLEIAQDEATKETIARDEKKASAPATCPAGMVIIAGKCTKPVAESAATECVYGNARQCLDLCGKKNGASCGKLGKQLVLNDNVQMDGTPNDRLQAGAKATMLGCKLDDGPSCEFLGDILASELGGKPDMPNAVAAWTRGCELAQEKACTRAGDAHYTANGVPQNYQLGAKLLDRGCMAGDQNACSELGIMFLGNAGLGTDMARAGRLFKQACEGASSAGCGNLGYLVEFGKATPKNPPLAAALYQKACKLSDESCGSYAQALHAGIGVQKNVNEALVYYRKACKANDISACATLRAFADPSTPLNVVDTKRNLEVWKGTCASGIERDCSTIGVVMMAAGSVNEGLGVVKKGCSMGDTWACELLRLKPAVR